MDLILNDDILTINGKAYKLVPDEEPTQEKARTGWERVNCGEKYYYVDTQSNSDWACDEYSYYSNGMYESGNYTNDEKLSDNIGRAVSIYFRMLRWQAENDVPVELHNPKVRKWYIIYNSVDKKLYTLDINVVLDIFCVYFSSEEKAKECAEVFKDDLIWLHTQFYRRLDERGVDNAEM